MRAKALVITGYGVNCEEETSYSLELAGAESRIVHINDLIKDKTQLENVDILAFPGGFSYADDTGSGKALANKIRNNIFEELKAFIERGGLVIGICNGFQVLVSLGLLPALGGDYGKKEVALILNDQARLVCRWVKLKITSEKCVFTKNLTEIEIPVAHGEGKFYAEEEVLGKLNANDQVVFRYVNDSSELAAGKYPYNPNGALEDIAGICDETGRVLGMMPHPERAIYWTSHPDYQQLKEKAKREGKKVPSLYPEALAIFKNAVEYVNNQK